MEEEALDISLEKVCYLVAKAREFDVKAGPAGSGDGARSGDDDASDILSDFADDPTYQELTEFLDGLNEDELINLVALVWLGRDDYGAEDWYDVVLEARQQATPHTTRYLLGVPLLADHLENALSILDLSCEDYDR